jgi:hypothetical protein
MMNGHIKTVVLKQKLCKCGHTNKNIYWDHTVLKNILIWMLHNTEASTTGSKFIQNVQKESQYWKESSNDSREG